MLGTKVLEERKSKFNGDIRVVRTFGLGTYIQARGLTQSGGIVNSFWDKTLRKIKKSGLDIKKVLILGIGGGSVAKLVNKYWADAKIRGVDIDPMMIELGQKYLDLGKVDIEIEIIDAEIFVKKLTGKNKFDLIIVDIYSGDKFPDKFNKDSFLKSLLNLLTPNGLVVFNRLSYGAKKNMAVKFGEKLQKIFRKVEYFYPGVNLMFLCSN